MARVELTVQELGYQGGLANVVLTAADATNDHQVNNDGNTLLMIVNEDVATKTVVIEAVDDPYGRKEDLTLVVPAASAGVPGVGLCGPFIPAIWNQPGAKLFVNLAADTSLKLAAVRYSARK